MEWPTLQHSVRTQNKSGYGNSKNRRQLFDGSGDERSRRQIIGKSPPFRNSRMEIHQCMPQFYKSQTFATAAVPPNNLNAKLPKFGFIHPSEPMDQMRQNGVDSFQNDRMVDEGDDDLSIKELEEVKNWLKTPKKSESNHPRSNQELNREIDEELNHERERMPNFIVVEPVEAAPQFSQNVSIENASTVIRLEEPRRPTFERTQRRWRKKSVNHSNNNELTSVIANWFQQLMVTCQ